MDDHRPNKYEESGIPIYYTVEKKRGTDNVRMTYRAFKEVAKSGAPEYGRILHEESHKVADGAEPLDTRIHATLQKYQSDFWAKAFKKEAVVNDIAKQFSSEKGLPLIVARNVHREKITSNLTDKERAFKQLVKEGFGGTPIGAFTSSVLGPTFSSHTKRDYQAVISFLRELQRLEQEQQRLSNCPLAHYRLWGSIGKIKSSTYIRRDISLSAIPKQQARSIVRSLVDDLEAKTNAGQSGKFEMGALLVLTMGIPAEEVCAPKQGNVIFPPQPYFPAHFHVSGICKKSGKKTFLLPYPENAVVNRKLPLPSITAQALHTYLSRGKRGNEQYLIPHNRDNNARLQYTELIRWINQRFKKELSDDRFLDGNGVRISAPSPYKRMLDTSKKALPHFGFEAEEENYFFGLAPKSTAAKYYCDFVNLAEQIHLRGLMDRWLGMPQPSVPSLPLCSVIRNPVKDRVYPIYTEGQVVQAYIELVFPPLTDPGIALEGYTLRIEANWGMKIDFGFGGNAI